MASTSPAQVLDRLAESYPDLSPQVRLAARHVLDQPGRVAVLSMRQLADETSIETGIDGTAVRLVVRIPTAGDET